MSQALNAFLSAPQSAENCLQLAQTLGCRETARAAQNLASLLDFRLADELVAVCLRQLAELLPTSAHPDQGLENLIRYIGASRSPQALLALFERDPTALPTLMRILATSQSWSEQLINDPESFDLLRMTEGLPVSRSILVDELLTESAGGDPQAVGRTLHTFRQRETMRIAFGDFLGAMPVATVAQQLSTLAESVLETALSVSRREALSRQGVPLNAQGAPARMCIVAHGRLGGNELSYSNHISLLFLCDAVVSAGNKSPASADYFERVARRALQLLADDAHASAQYTIDQKLRPEDGRDGIVSTLEHAVRYFENHGQSWQRMELIKARHVAGDPSLTAEFLSQLTPWIYRRYLSRSDITEIAALKRQLGKRVHQESAPAAQLNERSGGARDVEFLIQYLQLLNGGELEQVRVVNTLDAIAALERSGCLTGQERSLLEDNYRFLRRVEHRLQIVLGNDCRNLPESDPHLRQFLIASDFVTPDGQPDVGSLRQQLDERTRLNSRILDHLLSEAFATESGDVPAETDLILDPAPAESDIHELLAPYKFSDAQSAYRDLIALGQEPVSFLSTRRCRHFLAAIAPKLLQTLSSTPAPDATLSTLRRVSDSLGGKAVLWELFQSNAAAMELCIRLCATSPYLIGILTNSPGMIDELIDSLMLDRLPATAHIEYLLDELCRGVDDPGLVMHSFKNSMHLHIGVRDILGKDNIVDTHRALSDVAEACLKQTIDHEYHRLVQKLGVPIVAEGPRAGQPSEMIVLAVGKLGGREPNYHSDLDVLFLFEGEGTTRSLLAHRRHESINNRAFFNQLGQRIVKSITRLGPSGHLYELDARLRPLGGSVALAATLDDWQDYFCNGPAQLWERQALCKARPVWASPNVLPQVSASLKAMLTALPWRPDYAADIRRHRWHLEQGAAPSNIKRGQGGTLDVEFIVQRLQLEHGASEPQILVPGTIEALSRLQHYGFLSVDDGRALSSNYRWLRRVESGLRLLNLAARHELPAEQDLLDQLHFLLQTTDRTDEPADVSTENSAHPLLAMCAVARRRNRQIFNRVFDSIR